MNLREARFRAGMTQFDLRLRTGIHQTKISHFERGYLLPNENELEAMAEALQVPAEEIKFDDPTNSGS